MTAAAAAAPLRILLVEDDEFDVAVFGRAFRKSSIACEIVRCKNGEQVLAGLRDTALCFDLLVADHMLPGMSGFDLCLHLLEDSPPFALVLLTGGGSEQMAIRALRAGINEYIVKDSSQEYLDLLPLVLPKVARRHRERRAAMAVGVRGAAMDDGVRDADAQHASVASAPETAPPGPRDTASLGLSDCATVVSQRGGRVWIESSEHDLPMLHFAVPLAPDEAQVWGGEALPPPQPPAAECAPIEPEALALPPSRPPQTARDGFRHALIVHPNPIVTFVTNRILDRLGYRSAMVTGGQAAVEAVAREPFDLVLTALSMPRQDGCEVARQIRAREAGTGEHLPIVALAVDPSQDLGLCREAGIDAWVESPVSFEALNAGLAKVRPAA